MYKYKNNLLPEACRCLVDLASTESHNDGNKDYVHIPKKLRHINDFKIPRYKTNLRSKSLKVFGAKCWEKLENELKNLPSFKYFKNKLHQNILTQNNN